LALAVSVAVVMTDQSSVVMWQLSEKHEEKHCSTPEAATIGTRHGGHF